MKRPLLHILFLLLATSCAIRVSPTGGGKDVQAPQLLSSVPDTNATSFTGREVRLRFDEYVQLNDIQGQFIMSPLGLKTPDVTSNRREVIVKLPDSLSANTTYVLHFGKAIVDVHESNALEDFRFVFSTGPLIDSLSLNGQVSDAWQNEVLKNIALMAYKVVEGDSTDSLPFRRKPDYFARSTEKGTFSIHNMGAGTYQLFAVDDKNNNLICDPAEERLGFMRQNIILPDSMPKQLRIALTVPAYPRVLRQIRIDRAGAEVYFNKAVKNLRLKTTDGKPWQGYFQQSVRLDTLALWLPDTLTDSLQLILFDGQEVIDTIRMSLKASGSGREPALKLRFNALGDLIAAGPGEDLIFRAEHPVKSLDTLISMKEDSTTMQVRLFRDSLNFRLIRVRHAWKPGSRYAILLAPGSIRDVYGLTHDTLRSNFEMPATEKTASLSVRIRGIESGKQYLFELFNDKQEVLRASRLTGDTLLTFGYLPPGTARLRLIQDLDENGSWTTSDYALKSQPEAVFYYPESLTLRANWELEVLFPIPAYTELK